MRIMLSGVAMLAMLAAPAFAETRYDHKIEKAAMEIVAGKIGDLRGGFSYAEKVQLVVRQDDPYRSDGEMPAAASQSPAAVSPPPASAPRF